MKNRPDIVFETLARQFLTEHPSLTPEWRTILSVRAGDRIDLVCVPGSDTEVWATLRPGSIAVGSGPDHVDFEHFGANRSDEELALQALNHFRSLLTQVGFIPSFPLSNET